MTIKEIQDINVIMPLHNEIFGKEFPITSYYKKSKTNKLYIFVYEENSKLFGYSIIVDQEQDRNLYAWYGGVLPEFQGRGINSIFLDYLIELARKKDYLSVTLATTNIRPHMIRLATKFGFDIYDLKKRESGEGNKIYFRYKILPAHEENIPLSADGRKLKPVEIEEKLVRAYKSNCTSIVFDVHKNMKVLIYAIRYCNSFSKRPHILINMNGEKATEMLNATISQYKGEIEIRNN